MVRIKKKKAFALFVVFVLTLLISAFTFGCTQQSVAAGKYIAGTYSGEGNGMGGTITVTLTVDANNIVSVDEITDPGETAGLGGKEAIADGTFSSQIMDAQSAEIDGVSGATITTGGVQQGTTNALAKALNE